MKIKLIDFGGKVPQRSHYNDAGADVFALETTWIYSHETARIPLGIGVEIPDGFMGLVLPRSGLSSRGIVTQAAPIDSGYRGQIHAITSNLTNQKVKVSKGDKIGQLVIIPIILATYTNDDLELRGDAGFGSTGK